MKNIIFIPYAYDKEKSTGANIRNKNKSVNTYLKNVCVACISAKHFNPNDTVAMVTNLNDNEIPEEYFEVLKGGGIEILYFNYDKYIFPKETSWGLCFYKLCALSHLLELDYDNYCYLDSDTFIQGSFKYIWEEVRTAILLYDFSHGLQVKDYKRFCAEINQFSESLKYLTQYGGEFFAANKDNAYRYVNILEKIYQENVEKSIKTTMGDEYLISLAANMPEIKVIVKNASPYINRYWTNGKFRLVCTNYEYNKVSVLHLPDEKERGISKIYSKYISRHLFPSITKVWRICRLSKMPLLDKLKHVLVQICKN